MKWHADDRFPRIRELLPDVEEIYIGALLNEKDVWYSYKLMSLYRAVADISLPGAVAQFGVYKGRCARFLSSLLPASRDIFLLDSFEGLPENWIGSWKRGSFYLPEKEIPVFREENVRLIKGWFKDTVPELVKELGQPLSMLHLDADLYSSTRDVLDGLSDFIVPGTLLLFDEYFMISGDEFSDDEHRALHDWCKEYGREVEYLWRTQWVQVMVRVVK